MSVFSMSYVDFKSKSNVYSQFDNDILQEGLVEAVSSLELD